MRPRLFVLAYVVTTNETERFSASVAEPIVRLHPVDRETRRDTLC